MSNINNKNSGALPGTGSTNQTEQSNQASVIASAIGEGVKLEHDVRNPNAPGCEVLTLLAAYDVVYDRYVKGGIYLGKVQRIKKESFPCEWLGLDIDLISKEDPSSDKIASVKVCYLTDSRSGMRRLMKDLGALMYSPREVQDFRFIEHLDYCNSGINCEVVHDSLSGCSLRFLGWSKEQFPDILHRFYD